ncbi:MAG: GxxExxY protein [Flavobacteriales bacterium]|nr:GxxExxY protein [Flavobacteriales bacterium]
MTENELSYKIIGVVIQLRKHLGPGLLESAYQATVAYELDKLGFKVEQQVAMPLLSACDV